MHRASKYLTVAALGASVLFQTLKKRGARTPLSTTEQYGAAEAQRRHDRKVQRIATQLRARTSTTPVSLRKKAVSHQVPKAGDKKHSDEKIDVTALHEILEIDIENRTCTAESGVTFVDLVAATLPHGLVPIVVPELKTITIGGAVSGCSIESMSFRYGGFHDTCLEYELVTARGEVLICTADNEHALLFQMLHSSFGTLGIIAKLKFRLIAAKEFVKLDYIKFNDAKSYKEGIELYSKQGDVDFIDGIIHSKTEYILSVGRFVDEAPYTNRYDWMKVYYQSTASRKQDYLHTPHYFFRYDRGVTNVHPKSAIGRFVFGKFFGSSEMLRLAEKLHFLIPAEKPMVTLDVLLPLSQLTTFLDWFAREFGFFPLWCVPYRAHPYEWIATALRDKIIDDLFVDIAIYGMEQRDHRNAYKLIEEKLYELGGIKTLISHNYYTEEEFWKTWNRDNYAQAKAKSDPDNLFRDLYTKTCKQTER